MFSFASMRMPIVAAPMAGGPSTPALAAAVSSAGGLGFLAAGYKTTAEVAAEIAGVRALTDAPFGVNLFVPAIANASAARGEEASPDARAAAVAAYRTALLPEAARYGVELSMPDPADTDEWEDKIALLLRHPVPIVSFTFGCPDSGVIARLREEGSFVIVSVTDAEEARAAAMQAPGALCVQGPLGGGHRPTHSVAKTPGADDVLTLLRGIDAVVDIPLVAAGGITRAEQIARMLASGAAAVQMGTVFLRTPESGASAVYKAALGSGAFTETIATRAFSGRVARGLVNRFIRDHDRQAPAAYPEVNQLTRSLRAAAARLGDPDGMSLWAGIGFRDATEEPAAALAARLWAETQRVL